MTTRPGTGAEQLLLGHPRKRTCNLVEVRRTDGEVFRFSDHDKPLVFEGNTYSPAIFAGLSADRREAALRPGDQNLHGIIDGAVVVLQDLLGQVYRGAEVRHTQLDWTQPWLPFARHRSWIRTVHFTGATFMGVMEGRTQVLTRPAGGRFGGTFTVRCPYVLGGPFCPAVVVESLGVRVQSITRQRYEVVMTAATWLSPNSEDNYYRMGEVEWIWAAPVLQRTMTATSGDSSVTDSTQTWTTNQHAGRYVRVLNAAGGYVQQNGFGACYALIRENDATHLFFNDTDAMAGFGAGTNYDICPPCANVGVVSPIEFYKFSTLAVELTYPTPFPIAVDDSGIVRPGCDGLRATCVNKFAVGDSFGGRDHLSPLAGAVAEPPQEQ